MWPALVLPSLSYFTLPVTCSCGIQGLVWSYLRLIQTCVICMCNHSGIESFLTPCVFCMHKKSGYPTVSERAIRPHWDKLHLTHATAVEGCSAENKRLFQFTAQHPSAAAARVWMSLNLGELTGYSTTPMIQAAWLDVGIKSSPVGFWLKYIFLKKPKSSVIGQHLDTN